jgi:hypothetical protein
MPLHHTRIALNLLLRIPEASLAARAPAVPAELGAELADKVEQFCAHSALGYFPAIDFFRSREEISADLFDLLDSISWLAATLAREEINQRLRPVFSNVKVESAQCLAYALPSVRPGQPDAAALLANHYTPDRLRLELHLNLMQRREAVEGLERYASQVSHRWLSESFEDLQITHARRLL